MEDVLRFTTKESANRMVNTAYMIAGVLDQSLSDMVIALEGAKLRLNHEDKRLVNRIKTQVTQLRTNIEILRSVSVLSADTETQDCYDDTVLRFYVVFIRLLEIAGIDELCDLRFYSLFKRLEKYHRNLALPSSDYNSKIAFAEIDRNITEGKYPKEIMKILFNEDGDKQTEGKV